MAYRVEVDSSAQTILLNTVAIDDAIGARSSASFTVRDLAGALAFSKGQPVSIYDDSDVLVFAGFIDSAEREEIEPFSVKLYHHIKCADNHYLADKRIVAESYEAKTCGYIVDDLFDNYLADEGVTIGEIQLGATLTTCVLNYVRFSDAMDNLAEAAGFIWYISYDKKLYFIDRSTYAAPWAITTADILVSPKPALTNSNNLYRNQQYIRGGKALTDLQTEERKGDSKLTAFTMNYAIGKEPTSVKVNTIAKTVGIKGVDTGKDWYWNKGDAVLSQDSGGAVLAATDTLEVKYYGEYDIIVVATDEDAVAAQLAIEGSGTGIVEEVADEVHITDRDAAINSALAKLKQYSPTGYQFKFTTRRTGLKTGQLASVTFANYGLSAAEMLISAIKLERVNSEFWYRVTAIQGPDMGGWSKLFKDLANSYKSSISEVSVGSGTLVILKQVNATSTHAAQSIDTVWTCSVPGSTLYPSATLYPC
jgi:hypothetical protein